MRLADVNAITRDSQLGPKSRPEFARANILQ